MRRLRTAVLPLVVVLIGVAQVAYGRGASLNRPTIPQVAVILIGALALLRRRRSPRTVVVVTTLCGAAQSFLDPHLVIVDAAAVVALYTLAEATDRRTAVVLGGVAAFTLTATSVLWLPNHVTDIRNVLPVNYVTIAVAVGDIVRNQRALLRQEQRRALEAESTRAAQARQQVREERVRIARDLHDVVAHHITLVNAQAGVAHHLMRTDPERAYRALAGIEEASRAALEELRATVGLLRSDDEPQSLRPVPSFADLAELIGSFRSSGLEVRFAQQGTPRPLTASAEVAAYRIVQEALTNAHKHATRPGVDLELVYTEQTLEIAVTNPAAAGRHGSGTGHGLIGMRERAESTGGRCVAGLDDGGRFVVRAALPLPAPPQGLRCDR